MADSMTEIMLLDELLRRVKTVEGALGSVTPARVAESVNAASALTNRLTAVERALTGRVNALEERLAAVDNAAESLLSMEAQLQAQLDKVRAQVSAQDQARLDFLTVNNGNVVRSIAVMRDETGAISGVVETQ